MAPSDLAAITLLCTPRDVEPDTVAKIKAGAEKVVRHYLSLDPHILFTWV
jgi:hypothetical protein